MSEREKTDRYSVRVTSSLPGGTDFAAGVSESAKEDPLRGFADCRLRCPAVSEDFPDTNFCWDGITIGSGESCKFHRDPTVTFSGLWVTAFDEVERPSV